MAEVSENTLFRHFASKENLFWHSLRGGMAAVKSSLDSSEGIRDGDAPEVALPKMFNVLVNAISSSPGVLRLMAVACIELQGDAEALFCELFLSIHSEMTRYLAARAEKGEVLTVDPSILAASLIAIVSLHPQLSNLKVGSSLSSVDFPTGVQAYSKFWLDLLSPTTPVPENKTRRLELLTDAGTQDHCPNRGDGFAQSRR